MDTKIIQPYGEDILSYRLRSARQKKRMQHEDLEKKLKSLYKEEIGLWKKQKYPEWEPLIPPIQKGWKRFFVLRIDMARGRQAEFFQGILKKINTYDWSHRKDFLVKKRRFGRNKYDIKSQKLLEPWSCHFVKLGFNEKEKQMFRAEFHYEKWKKGFVKRFVFNEPWRFVLVVRPNMITKIKILDAVLESRVRQIDNYMTKNDLRKKQARLINGNYKNKCCKKFEKYNHPDPFKNRSLNQVLDLIKE